MKILLTGTTGYIGKRLLPVLLNAGHEVFCCVRDRNRFDFTGYQGAKFKVIELDFLDHRSLEAIPSNIDAAYYLIHSMSASIDKFDVIEELSARNFKDRMEETGVKQVIYLSGIVNEKELSKHLASRKNVEDILAAGSYNLTTLRAGIIVGSGSASFEIMRDLVEKLPVMIAPRWLNTRSQPIAISNVLEFLKGVLLNESTFGKALDIGGPEVLTYKEMLLIFARVRGLRRIIVNVPVMTPKLSSYWLYFVTSTSYKLAVNLVHSMKVEIVCRENDLNKRLNMRLVPYEAAVKMSLSEIGRQRRYFPAGPMPSRAGPFPGEYPAWQTSHPLDASRTAVCSQWRMRTRYWTGFGPLAGRTGGTMPTGYGGSGVFWINWPEEWAFVGEGRARPGYQPVIRWISGGFFMQIKRKKGCCFMLK